LVDRRAVPDAEHPPIRYIRHSRDGKNRKSSTFSLIHRKASVEPTKVKVKKIRPVLPPPLRFQFEFSHFRNVARTIRAFGTATKFGLRKTRRKIAEGGAVHGKAARRARPVSRREQMARIIAAYNEAVQTTFALLKETATTDLLQDRRIPLNGSAGLEGFLVPVCRLNAVDRELIATIARWREANSRWYPTQFQVTLEGTAAWLREQVLGVPDRIMFLVTNRQGTPLGHLGFANALNDECTMKIDNVMRGVDACEPGMMGRSLRQMLDWAQNTFAPSLFYLPVFRDNEHAIHFYRRHGFRDDSFVPLRRHQESDRIRYRVMQADDTATPDRYHLRMIYVPGSAA
jgi:RimJ/RimL family protein N-acetyltransferase